MDKEYLQLFIEIVHAAELLAEQVIEYDNSQNDENGAKTAEIMRNDYAKLYDKMRDEKFDFTSLTKADYAKFLVAALIVVNNIESKIKNEELAVKNYKIDIIPKLERIINEIKDEENASELAKELFTINKEKK